MNSHTREVPKCECVCFFLFFLNFIPQFLCDATDALRDAKRILIAIKTVAPVSREPKIYEVGEQKQLGITPCIMTDCKVLCACGVSYISESDVVFLGKAKRGDIMLLLPLNTALI